MLDAVLLQTARSGLDNLTHMPTADVPKADVSTGSFSKPLGKCLCLGSLADSVCTTPALQQPTFNLLIAGEQWAAGEGLLGYAPELQLRGGHAFS